MDNELRTILFSADKSKQQKFRDLLKVYPIRYNWAKNNDMSGKKSGVETIFIEFTMQSSKQRTEKRWVDGMDNDF